MARHTPQAASQALAKAQADKAALAEECGTLKGRVTALEEQLAGLQAAAGTTEAMRTRWAGHGERGRSRCARGVAPRAQSELRAG